MTELTASGWLWAAWCVFSLAIAIVATAQWLDNKLGMPDHEWFVALLSIGWLAWLVSP